MTFSKRKKGNGTNSTWNARSFSLLCIFVIQRSVFAGKPGARSVPSTVYYVRRAVFLFSFEDCESRLISRTWLILNRSAGEGIGRIHRARLFSGLCFRICDFTLRFCARIACKLPYDFSPRQRRTDHAASVECKFESVEPVAPLFGREFRDRSCTVICISIVNGKGYHVYVPIRL